jgi:hypothetical protein
MRRFRSPFWLATLTLGILAAWSVAYLPVLYQRVKLDRSFPALSRYEFETTPDVVLVGSSMTFRLYEGYFRQPRLRNIAISGGSPLTGLSIIASYDSLPRLILVETNIMSRPIDAALVVQFGKNESEPYKWFRPMRTAISRIYYWIKYKSEADNIERLPKLEPSDYDISESVSFTRKEYQSTKLDDGMAKNTEVLKQLVAHLERRGCKILLYELPYPDGLGETHYAVTARNLVRAAFPDAEMWLKLDRQTQALRWLDASHMDERSAIIVAQEIESGLEERSNSAAGTLATRKAVLR